MFKVLALVGVGAIKINSIPACTSYECKTETAAKGVDYDIFKYGE